MEDATILVVRLIRQHSPLLELTRGILSRQEGRR